MEYLPHIYILINAFILGYAFSNFPKYREKTSYLKYIIVVVGLSVLYLSLGVFIFIIDISPKPQFFLRKTHVQINRICIVWGNGLNTRDNKFIKINEFQKDERFKVVKLWFIYLLK